MLPMDTGNYTLPSFFLDGSHKELYNFTSFMDEDLKKIIHTVSQCLDDENYARARQRYEAFFGLKRGFHMWQFL